MERILITGGAGYIGSVLTQSLIDKGYKYSDTSALMLFDELNN